MKSALINGCSVRAPFASGADFAPMLAPGSPPPPPVSDVLHKVVVECDEAGTEAAAATAVVMTRALLAAPEEFLVDRPFVFGVRHVATRAWLFVGRVADVAPGKGGAGGARCCRAAVGRAGVGRAGAARRGARRVCGDGRAVKREERELVGFVCFVQKETSIGLQKINPFSSQCLKCLTPVVASATPYLSQHSTASPSRREPPGCAIAATPAWHAISTLSPHENGKNASDARADP